MKGLLTGVALVLLGILGLILDVGNIFPGTPEVVEKVFGVIGLIVGFMGLREMMLQSKANIISKVMDFTSQTFLGSLLLGVLTILLDGDLVNVPPALDVAFQLIGAILVALGLRDAGKRGVFAKS